MPLTNVLEMITERVVAKAKGHEVKDLCITTRDSPLKTKKRWFSVKS